MAADTWVLVEQWRGGVSEITFEMLTLGRELASALDGTLQAVVLGCGAGGVVSRLGAADAVLIADHALLAEPVPDIYALALVQLVRQYRPGVLLIPQTNLTMEVGALLAARLEAPYLNSCRDAQVIDGRLVAQCVLYGGKIDVRAAPQESPAVLGILPGVRPQEPGRVERTPPMSVATVDLPAQPVQFMGYTDPPPGDVDISREQVLVGVGRGIQRAENVTLAEDLAAALGGAVCGSRPVIDQGWLPISRQVGTSGTIVRPQVYLALGISGAPEHVEGMKHAALIIAVNTDARAPIFNIAHYGAVADALEILPVLIDAVQAREKAA